MNVQQKFMFRGQNQYLGFFSAVFILDFVHVLVCRGGMRGIIFFVVTI